MRVKPLETGTNSSLARGGGCYYQTLITVGDQVTQEITHEA